MPPTQRSLQVKKTRIIAGLLLGAAVAGCSSSPAPPAATTAAPQPASFDGLYQGSVQVSGAAAGTNPQSCETDPRLALQVSGGSFTYVQSHPNLVNTAPSLTPQATTVTYTASIGPDGSIRGNSGSVGGTLQGTVSGTHMSG